MTCVFSYGTLPQLPVARSDHKVVRQWVVSSEVYAVVSRRIQVVLDVTLPHAVSGGQCVLGTCHLHLPWFRGP